MAKHSLLAVLLHSKTPTLFLLQNLTGAILLKAQADSKAVFEQPGHMADHLLTEITRRLNELLRTITKRSSHESMAFGATHEPKRPTMRGSKNGEKSF